MTSRSQRIIAGGLGILIVAQFAQGFQRQADNEKRDREGAVRAYQQDLETWQNRVLGCERAKADRAVIASALRAQSTYLNLVLKAQSVQADVKHAARANQKAQDAAASDLESRTGDNLSCTAVTRRPRPPGAE